MNKSERVKFEKCGSMVMNKTSNSASAGSSSPSPNLLGKKCIWPGGHSMIIIIIRMITIIMFIVIMTRMMSIIVLTFLLLNMPRCVIGLFEATRWTKQYQTILFWDFFKGTCLLGSLAVWTLDNLCHRSPHQCFHIRPIRLVTLTTFLHSSRYVDNFSPFDGKYPILSFYVKLIDCKSFSNTSAQSTL